MEEQRKKYTTIFDGLSASVGADGTWLKFESSKGRSALVNIEETFRGNIIKVTILEWINDRLGGE